MAEGTGTKKRTSIKKWIKKEMTIDRRMIPVKLMLFMYVSGIGTFLPYLTLHMQEIGLSMEEIALIYAVIPFAAVLGPSLSGILADKFGNYKMVLAINIILTGVFHSLLLIFPPMATMEELTQNKTHYNQMTNDSLMFRCHNDGYSLRTDYCDKDCLQFVDKFHVDSFRNCYYDCLDTHHDKADICFTDSKEYTTKCLKLDLLERKIEFNATILKLNATKGFHYRVSDIAIKNKFYKIHGNISCPSSCSLMCVTDEIVMCRAKNEHYETAEDHSNWRFYAYFVIRAVANLALWSGMSMLDTFVLAKIKQEGSGDFGKQRIMIMLGQAFAPLIAGFLVDVLNQGAEHIDYSFAFYLSDALLLISLITLYQTDLEVEIASPNVLQDLRHLLSKMEINIFLILVTILGMNWGFMETYLFLHLTEMNAPTYMLGITLTVGMCSGIPILFVADQLNEKIGRHNIFLISFIAYFIRFFGYSWITNPWMALPFEVLEVFTYQIMWVAAATYCPILAPKGLLATMTCIAGAAHYTLGQGLGSFIGGYVILWVGASRAFRIFGYTCLGGAAFHVFTHYCILTKDEGVKQVEQEEKDEKDEPKEEEMKAMI